ncbi:DNA invertase Pin-like site-specific DNA recombinase [Bosea sp. AK1]|uniref:recombinase family protein n=1 Tax=Bosea sp. AK1 TaxID=2587160 RepID=UPI00115176D3|nr:recombinase family protein [Bosea sp. AK1]TQI75339.1 DNA invertase Pin-like site-specific DNA recombinase [Bosea sp. AK1]
MRRIGYARVSTYEQNLDLQLAALQAAGCSEVFTDHGVSGASFDRPGLADLLTALEPSDMLVVWRLDRLGRSLVELVRLISELGARQVEFHSLSEAIDTSSPGGRLLFHLLAAMAEFERSLISERTRAGMAAAQARGKHVGRQPALNAEQRHEARLEVKKPGADLAEIAGRYGVHPRTLLRVVKQSAPSEPPDDVTLKGADILALPISAWPAASPQ